ncbi:MAG: sigma-70 family RNA polymerase sigma factor [Bacteroidota bacterium]
MDSTTLVSKCLKRDRKAQRELFDRYKGMVMGICRRYARHTADADDLFQEVFIKIFVQLKTLKNPEALGGWIKTIAVRTSLTYYQKQKTKNHENWKEIEELKEVSSERDKEIISDLDLEILLACLQHLPDSHRMVFNLFVIEGYRHQEIAELLSISEASSRVYLTQARKTLQKHVSRLYHKGTETYES